MLNKLADEYKIEILDTALCYRVSYKESASMGLGVFECEGEKHIKATAEMNQLFNEINKLLETENEK
jgi:hypothetical protein